MGYAQEKVVTEQDAREALANMTKMHEALLAHTKHLEKQLQKPYDRNDDPAWMARFAKLQAEYLAQKPLELT